MQLIYCSTYIRWLVKKHREKKAAKVLSRIYQNDEKEIEEELSGIEASVVNTKKEHFLQKLKLFHSWKFIQRSASCLYISFRFFYDTLYLYTTGWFWECVYRSSIVLLVVQQFRKSVATYSGTPSLKHLLIAVNLQPCFSGPN